MGVYEIDSVAVSGRVGGLSRRQQSHQRSFRRQFESISTTFPHSPRSATLELPSSWTGRPAAAVGPAAGLRCC